jgi:hypothetical protein
VCNFIIDKLLSLTMLRPVPSFLPFSQHHHPPSARVRTRRSFRSTEQGQPRQSECSHQSHDCFRLSSERHLEEDGRRVEAESVRLSTVPCHYSLSRLIYTAPFFSFISGRPRLYDCTVVGHLEEDYVSEEIDGEPDPRLESGRTAQERQLLNYHPPSNSSSPILPTSSLPHSYPQQDPSSSHYRNQDAEADEELVRGLEALVGEDADEELALRGPDGRIDFVEGEDGELYEITEQVTETEIETRTVEHYNLGRGEGVAAEEWSEVEALTQLAEEEERSGMDVTDSDRGRAATRTVVSKAYADALERPHASSMRVQIIVRFSLVRAVSRKDY